eukprot:6184691-Pleurochrysis_carterae.AAC.1
MKAPLRRKEGIGHFECERQRGTERQRDRDIARLRESDEPCRVAVSGQTSIENSRDCLSSASRNNF